jgi:hypothetical protein
MTTALIETETEIVERTSFLRRLPFKKALATAASTLVLLSGCGAQQPVEQAEAPPVLLMEVTQLDQYDRIGKKPADGQFVLATVSLTNQTQKDFTVMPAEFVLQNITDIPEEQFSQGVEQQMGPHFRAQFGEEQSNKLMDFQGALLHPKNKVTRYLIYSLPKDAKLKDYEIYYKSAGAAGGMFGGGAQTTARKITAPLVGTNTIVNDNRTEF